MGQVSILCYRPKPGKDAQLLELAREHIPILRAQGLVTDREPYLMRAADGTLVEVFEWRSADAIEAAHANPEVGKLWQRYADLSDYVKLGDLAETRELFANFEPID